MGLKRLLCVDLLLGELGERARRRSCIGLCRPSCAMVAGVTSQLPARLFGPSEPLTSVAPETSSMVRWAPGLPNRLQGLPKKLPGLPRTLPGLLGLPTEHAAALLPLPVLWLVMDGLTEMLQPTLPALQPLAAASGGVSLTFASSMLRSHAAISPLATRGPVVAEGSSKGSSSEPTDEQSKHTSSSELLSSDHNASTVS